jgi:mono/diheme cytochrome c family protein
VLDAMTPSARGEVLFGVYCASCHGAAGVGGSAPALNRHFLGMRPTIHVRDVIAGGVPGTEMVAWSQANGGLLDDRTLDELSSLVTGWRRAAQPSPTPELVRAAILPGPPGPWVFPFGVITFVSFAMTLILLAVGFLKE